MTLEETELRYGIKVALLETLEEFVSSKEALTIRNQDNYLDELIPTNERDEEFANFTSVVRMIKDSYEVGEMQKAIDSTIRGFSDMVKVFPAATKTPRGERVISATAHSFSAKPTVLH